MPISVICWQIVNLTSWGWSPARSHQRTQMLMPIAGNQNVRITLTSPPSSWVNHPPCTDSTRSPYVVIVDTSSIHHLLISFCRCLGHKPDDEQMLDMGFFPMSFKNVKTVFTFKVLDDFQLDNLEAKTTAYQFYLKLWRVTSLAFPHLVPVLCLASSPHQRSPSSNRITFISCIELAGNGVI